MERSAIESCASPAGIVCRRPLDAVPGAELVQRLGETFPTDVVSALVELWSGRERVPQESFGLQQLGGRDTAQALVLCARSGAFP